jgi:head-tail adaptor
MDIGALRHRVTLTNFGTSHQDGDGGWVQDPITLGARLPASVEPATARALERLVAKTSEAVATHIVTLRFLPGVTTQTRVTFHDGATDRVLFVTGWADAGERHQGLALLCNEKVV